MPSVTTKSRIGVFSFWTSPTWQPCRGTIDTVLHGSERLREDYGFGCALIRDCKITEDRLFLAVV